ncbi:MAG TPA: PmoA family protein [Ohtaekwangia sp.]
MKCRLTGLCIYFFMVMSGTVHAQTIATFEIDLTKSSGGIDVPVSIVLDNVSFVSDSSLTLVEVQGGKTSSIPFQIRQGEQRTLHWIAKTGAQKRTYQLVKSAPGKSPEVTVLDQDGTLTIQSENKNLLRYYHKTVEAPAGANPNYRRSGFIHPLWTPNGQELTRIQPSDHYHHYGIWNPWTHVLFEGDTVDFWNIAGKKGTVRFASFPAISTGPVFAEYEALHEHVAFKKDGTEKIALNEIQTVRVYKPSGDYYIVDITSQLSCASTSEVNLLTYRYGGLGWRTTEYWDNKNSEVLTSDGKDRKTADGSKARWCIVQGALPNDFGGVVMMSYPANYNHPEPLRIWPENQYNRGDMFANFSPTKDKDWLLLPGKTYVLRYRLVVFNGKFTKEKAESAWQNFATPAVIKIVKK